MENKYTISEIDKLRRLCRDRYLWGEYIPKHNGSVMSRSYKEEDMVKSVEEMVRTFMMAGTRP